MDQLTEETMYESHARALREREEWYERHGDDSRDED